MDEGGLPIFANLPSSQRKFAVQRRRAVFGAERAANHRRRRFVATSTLSIDSHEVIEEKGFAMDRSADVGLAALSRTLV
jgi:hypothetical protein